MTTTTTASQININPKVMKEGFVKKRSGRMVQWTSRYFVLHENGLYYKLKQVNDDHSDGIPRGKFEFVPGCIVTDINEESRVNIKGKKLYSFWIVWPHDKNEKNTEKNDNDSDIDENDHIIEKDSQLKMKEDEINRNNSSNMNKTNNTRNKDLQAIILREEDEQKRQKELVEEQLELHQAHDANVSNGAKIAAVTVGGFAIGALTMGIGLLPYLALVGATVVASGGAVAYNSRLGSPSDSRLIMAFDTFQDASDWKVAIEKQIKHTSEMKRCPLLPDSVDAKMISNIIEISRNTIAWQYISTIEAIRIFEFNTTRMNQQEEYSLSSHSSNNNIIHYPIIPTTTSECSRNSGNNLTYKVRIDDIELMQQCWWLKYIMANDYFNLYYPLTMNNLMLPSKPITTYRYRKGQLSMYDHSLKLFLTLMNEKHSLWPIHGTIKVIKEVNDHTDIIEVELVTEVKKISGKTRKHLKLFRLSRFWQMDENGIYLITFNSIKDEEILLENNDPAINNGDKSTEIFMNAVITIAPRRRNVLHIDQNNSILKTPEINIPADKISGTNNSNLCLISCVIQVDTSIGDWKAGELTSFMNEFIKNHLSSLKYKMCYSKYNMVIDHNMIIQTNYKPISSLQLKNEKRNYSREKSLSRSNKLKGVTTIQPGAKEQLPDSMNSSTNNNTYNNTVQRSHSSALSPAASLTIKNTSNSRRNQPASLTIKKTSNSRRNQTSALIHPSYSSGSSCETMSSGDGSESDYCYNHNNHHNNINSNNNKINNKINNEGGITNQCDHSDINIEEPLALSYHLDSKQDPIKRGFLARIRSKSNSMKSNSQSYDYNYKDQNNLMDAKTFSNDAEEDDKDDKDKNKFEIAQIRDNIDATNYEIQKLMKSIKKKVTLLQDLQYQAQESLHSNINSKEYVNKSKYQANASILTNEISGLNKECNQLEMKLSTLKDNYYTLTGDKYEISKGTKGLISRWRNTRIAKQNEKDRKIIQQTDSNKDHLSQQLSNVGIIQQNTAISSLVVTSNHIMNDSSIIGGNHIKSYLKYPYHWNIIKRSSMMDYLSYRRVRNTSQSNLDWFLFVIFSPSFEDTEGNIDNPSIVTMLNYNDLYQKLYEKQIANLFIIISFMILFTCVCC